jgi:hypothetical protein
MLAALSVLWFYLFSELAASDSGRRWLSWQNWAVVWVMTTISFAGDDHKFRF